MKTEQFPIKDYAVIGRLCKEPPTSVSHAILFPSGDTLRAIDNKLQTFSGPKEALAWTVLFSLARLDKSGDPTVAVPFLERDAIYDAVPAKTVRFNMIPFTEGPTTVPLIQANMVDGIPVADAAFDLIVVNHGTRPQYLSLRSRCGIDGPRTENQYFHDLSRVLRPDGLFLAYDTESFDPELKMSSLAAELNTHRVSFRLPEKTMEDLRAKTGKVDAESFEDLFACPETYDCSPIFLAKNRY